MKHNTIKKISQEEISRNQVEGNLPDKPSQAPLYGGRTLTPEEIKGFFDKLPKLIAERYNELVAAVQNGEFDGKSAYQYAVEYGYEGSEEEFGAILAEMKTYKEYTDQHLFDHDEAIHELQGDNEQLYMIADEVLYKADNHEKRLTNLEKGLPADRFVTDDSVAYIKNIPTNACPYAAVEKVGGITKKSENLIPFPYYYKDGYEGAGLTILINDDGTIIVNGTCTAAINWQLMTEIPITAGKYFISGCPIGGSSSTYRIFAYLNHSNGTTIYPNDFGEGIAINAEEGDTIMLCLAFAKGATLNNVIFKPMLNKGDSALPFERYYEGIRRAKVTAIESKDASGNILGRIEIPTEVQNLDGYGEGAGTASNAIVWNADGIAAFEKRCKKITLTNEMATYRDIYAPNFRFGFTISDKAPSVGFVGNMVSNIAVLADPITTPTTAKEYSIAGSNSGGAAYVIVPNITSAADAIAYLNAHPIELWYETTNPESTDISDLITADNLIEVEGGGTLTFVNEYGAAVPSTILYQVKGE